MKKSIPLNAYLWFLLATVLLSCQKEEPHTPTMPSQTTKAADNAHGVLEKKLDIPYTVGNMQKALKEVMTSFKHQLPQSKLAKVGKTVEIQPSHFYYRFLPKDSLEYERLATDTVLLTSNAPLDYEIATDGDYFDDEGTEEDNSFGYQYTVFPADHAFPQDITHQKLNDLYFAPEEETGTMEKGEITVQQPQSKTSKALAKLDENGELFEFLELEALKLTNNLEEDELETLRFFLPNDPSGKHYTHSEALALGYALPQLHIDYAHIMAQQQKEGTDSAARWWKRKKWNPHGRITVREDAIGRNVGVVGAEVRVRKWGLVVIKRTRTNAKGEFRTSSTKTKRVKYAVYFNSNHRKFVVKAGTIFWDARHRGTRTYKNGGWHQHFSYGRGKFYALVHNAVYDFYNRAVGKFGLNHPNQSWLRINAQYTKESGDHLDLNPGGKYSLVPHSEIRVGRMDNGKPMASDEIYALATHEMTHASHYRMDRTFFINIKGAGCTLQTMAESWATGVETVVTNDRYLGLKSNYIATGSYRNYRPLNLFNSERQAREIRHRSNNEYTPIVIDLVDDFNQRDKLNNSALPIDRVKGYTLKQIQTSLNHARGPHGWKERLKSQHYNSTEVYVDELFSVYMYDNCKTIFN
nr:hypothetical protein [Allomuricauda sp.]